MCVSFLPAGNEPLQSLGELHTLNSTTTLLSFWWSLPATILRQYLGSSPISLSGRLLRHKGDRTAWLLSTPDHQDFRGKRPPSALPSCPRRFWVSTSWSRNGSSPSPQQLARCSPKSQGETCVPSTNAYFLAGTMKALETKETFPQSYFSHLIQRDPLTIIMEFQVY